MKRAGQQRARRRCRAATTKNAAPAPRSRRDRAPGPRAGSRPPQCGRRRRNRPTESRAARAAPNRLPTSTATRPPCAMLFLSGQMKVGNAAVFYLLQKCQSFLLKSLPEMECRFMFRRTGRIFAETTGRDPSYRNRTRDDGAPVASPASVSGVSASSAV
jgi:hypothetical protein